MKVLLTGSTGFLGKEVCSLLKLKKVDIFKISRKKKHGYINCDLRNQKKIDKILKKIKPDVIINLAATIDFKKKNIEKFKLNFNLPKILSNYCKKFKKSLIHISTIYVHGVKKIYSEKSKFSYSSIYGYSKFKGDRAILKSRCDHTIIRFPGIFGINGPEHLFINKILKKNLQKKTIQIDNNGNQKRNYIFVKDAAKFICDCLSKKLRGIFYVGGETLTIKEMFNRIKNNYNFKNIQFNNKKTDSDQIVIANYKINYTTFNNAIKNLKK